MIWPPKSTPKFPSSGACKKHTNKTKDEWDRFLIPFNPQDGSIHKINKKLLRISHIFHPLKSPSGAVYSAYVRAELFTDTFKRQFETNPGTDIAEVIKSLLTISNFITQ